MKKGLYITLAILFAIILISGTIDLNNLFDYENQFVPTYITKDNTNNNLLTNEGATLGRVLFYDKNLSTNNSVSCSSCHIQEFAFGDTAQASIGVNGSTGRHSMRLINSGFSDEVHFFWDERAATLEQQTTMPIQDPIEMGFSGTVGNPDMDSLLIKLSKIDYYQTLFSFQFGDPNITEERIQFALAQFIRSIQSFDSKFDTGMTQAGNINSSFSNFTSEENMGKNLFLAPPQFDTTGHRISGGVGCAGCHRGPEFDIDTITGSNGVFESIMGPNDITSTKSPSLRDVFNPQGNINGLLMHNGLFINMEQVLSHYNNIPDQPINNNLDPRLRPGGNLQRLNLTPAEHSAIIAFMKTLTGLNVYTDARWSDPFDANGDIDVIEVVTSVNNINNSLEMELYPNPVIDYLTISGELNNSGISIFGVNGTLYLQQFSTGNSTTINLNNLPNGVYLIKVTNIESSTYSVHKIVKQ